MNTILSAGFADPVADAQACFRAVLDAMARPGQVHTVAGVTPPAPLNAAAAAVLLTLADHETPLWLDPDAEPAAGWVDFHCGAPPAGQAQAAFALALSPVPLDALSAGTHEAPETSATLILQVSALGSGRRYRLRGPGLRETASLSVAGLPDDFALAWKRNHALFPRGVDLILCAGAQLAALPRSLTVEEG
jgi:alpha-D-ribose 1-methylphosphonate 5-triphosphate synthase subunit PhnH